MITLEFNESISADLAALVARLDNPADLMAEIADQWLQSTQDRVQAAQTPDGTPFAPRSQTTIDNYGHTPFGHPLNKTGTMRRQIAAASGPDFAEIGSNAVQAAMMHFGGSKAEYPKLWGDIPARPFLGVSEQDEADFRDTILEWLEEITD